MRYRVGLLTIVLGVALIALGASDFLSTASDLIHNVTQNAMQAVRWDAYLRNVATGTFIYGLAAGIAGCNLVMRSY